MDEPEPVSALAGIDWRPSIGWPRRFVGDLLATGHQFERVYDLPNRQGANLFLEVPAPPEDGSRYTLRDSTAIRSDGGAIAKVGGEGRDSIVVGRPPDLRVFTMPGGGSVAAISFLGVDLALLLRQTTAAGDVVGVFRLDTSSGALTPLVAATPAAEWAGVTGWCEDPTARCGGLFGTVGCAVDEPACPDGSSPACSIYYAKVDADDTSKTAAYVHDVNAGTTSKLAGANPDRFFTDRQLLVWGSFPEKYTRYRNLCGGVERECPFSPGEVIAGRPDGGGFTTFGVGSHLNVVNVSDGTCIQPDPAATLDAIRASYAPGSDRLMWVALSETTRTLWLADGQGQSPVAVASGELPWSNFSPDGQTIYVKRYEESRIALSWIDAHRVPAGRTDSVHEHRRRRRAVRRPARAVRRPLQWAGRQRRARARRSGDRRDGIAGARGDGRCGRQGDGRGRDRRRVRRPWSRKLVARRLVVDDTVTLSGLATDTVELQSRAWRGIRGRRCRKSWG